MMAGVGALYVVVTRSSRHLAYRLATALALGARLKLAIPLALIAPVGVHLVFYKLLRVPLPDGLLPMPW